ncbi:OmpA family protein [Flammeovirga yaeyamensis]|uniref:OmpA family protein n=1 Tax=Flammeovirga yaeyamensis TaxID=367791 RepID=A0AAX1N1S0_9BACT|nr:MULTISPECIES: OmpA family protein [Flammeovirga]ANQ48557.1 OmpA family protein [Flammeovirga sp. MY04]MBB3696451.1 outer membrane protein OmpA-like peptidoglycan-associated protein [Flammeovirga yaeyamensis]NMF35130.1 OmpA family protein [Flammeovirga yaeyamensis]QWG00050.1 OmpA family protein [Flammeovirga yaeyamensis]
MQKKFLLGLNFLLITLTAFSQGVSSNPMILKLSGYDMIYSEEKPDEIEFPMSDVDIIPLAGNKTFATFKYQSAGKHPNNQQILQTYFDKVRSLRGKPLYKGDNYGSFQIKSNTKKFWCVIETHEGGESYTVTIIGQDKIQEAETAQEMLELLKSQGSMDLYFQFATGSATLSKASQQTVDELAKLLKKYAPKLKLSIEGHTDNVGSVSANKKLSLDRAISVKKQLIRKGIDPSRLETVGWGSERPLESNDTEKGRTKNRRVSIKALN